MNQSSKYLLKYAGIAALAVAGAVYSRRRAARFSFTDRVVIISGGSRGLGLEMARQLVSEGARVAICSRNLRDIEEAVGELELRGGRIFGMSCDVTDEVSVNRLIHSVLTRWGRVDALINNAGIIQVGPLDAQLPADFEKAMNTHFWGPYHMTQAVLPSMRERNQGRIVNISSIGGRVSVPHLLPYCASKFALTGYSEGLTAELRQHGIFVTTVNPGVMITGSPRKAEFKGRHRAEYAWFSIGASAPLLATNSRTAAKRIIEACRRGSPVTMVSWPSRLAATLHGALPGTFVAALSSVSRLLPSPDGTTQSFKGRDSESMLSPSWITALNEQAAVRNREI